MPEADRAEGTGGHHHLQHPNWGCFAKLGGRQMPTPQETTSSFLPSPLKGLWVGSQRSLRACGVTPGWEV